MTQAVLKLSPLATLELPIRARPRAAAPLIARLVPPPRELALKRSWIIGGYGRALPRPIDELPAGRRLLRPYQLRLDQIVREVPGEVYELSEAEVVRG